MNLLIPFWSVFVLCLFQDQAPPAFIPGDRLSTPGHWIGLYSNNITSKLIKIKINESDINNNTDYYDTVVALGTLNKKANLKNDYKPILFFPIFSKRMKGNITTVPIKPFIFSKTEDDGDAKENIQSKHLRIEKDSDLKTLVFLHHGNSYVISNFPLENSIEIEWAGDLNGDGWPEILLTEREPLIDAENDPDYSYYPGKVIRRLLFSSRRRQEWSEVGSYQMPDPSE